MRVRAVRGRGGERRGSDVSSELHFKFPCNTIEIHGGDVVFLKKVLGVFAFCLPWQIPLWLSEPTPPRPPFPWPSSSSSSSRRSALALMGMEQAGVVSADILSEDSLHNAIGVPCGGRRFDQSGITRAGDCPRRRFAAANGG